MPNSRTFGFGKLGLQLMLAFVGVALAAIFAALSVYSMTVNHDFMELMRSQQRIITRSVAAEAGAQYGDDGWPRADLNPVMALVAHTGSGVEIRSSTGRVVRSSPGFATIATHGINVTEPIVVRGRRVGVATVAFDRGLLTGLVTRYVSERWSARVASALIAILIALVAAAFLSRMITAPVDRLIWAARARMRGSTDARVGDIKSFGRLKELAAAFDEMADAKEEQDQLRRNLVADVAHELRTPIAVLQAGHEAMLDGITEPTPEQLATLRDEVLRLSRMVDDLQRLASAEAAAVQLTLIRRDLAAVAAAAAASLVDSFEASGVTLVERLTKVEVLCDPLRMHEVVVNLLTNALKFTPAGGLVKLETEQSDGTGRLRVIDTGVGIPPDELPHVSERFFRGQQSSGVAGSGIGLTIVDELVRAHYGSLNISSRPGQGTTVSVFLPLARAGRADLLLAQRHGRPRSSSRRRHAGIISKADEADEKGG
jgi:two-component system, OmpR family, sensor histidine kinase BaeS